MEVKMSSQNIAETQMLIKFIEKLPFSDDEKKNWLEFLHTEGINDEILEQVKQKFHEIPADKFASDWIRAKNNMEMTSLVKRWQMSKASKNFHHTR
jgi:hypothetical protein